MYRILCVVGLAVVLVCGSDAIARGDLVSNGSFESPAVGDGAAGGLTGWNEGLWAAPEGAWNPYNPTDGYFPGSSYVSPGQPGYLPNPAEGLQTGYGYLKSGSWMYMYQDVGDPTINTKYTLTFAVGAGLISATPDWDVMLIDTATQATIYAKMNSGDAGVSLPTAGTFVENMISWTNTTVTTGGLQVFIAVTGKAGVEGWQEMFIDNIRLTAETVPEPCAISMVGTALVGLLAYAWRKRK